MGQTRRSSPSVTAASWYQFDHANVRLVCEDDYIGILGAKDDLSALLTWVGVPRRLRAGHARPPGSVRRPAAVAANP